MPCTLRWHYTVKTLKYEAVLKTIPGTDRNIVWIGRTLEILFPISPFTTELDNLETNSQPPLHLEHPLICFLSWFSSN